LVRFPALLSHGPALKASGQRSIRGESVDRQRHNQTEEFNNYRDQLYGFVLTPTPAITWTLNYYQGQEHPDVIYLQSQPPGMPRLPNQQGTSILPLVNPPDGKLQIGDTYVSWQASKALLFAAEADYVQERLFSYSSPQRTLGGALYAGYQITPKVAFAARAEYAHTRLPCHERLFGARRIPTRPIQSALLLELHAGIARNRATHLRIGPGMVARPKRGPMVRLRSYAGTARRR
jgi:hypothetical protein